MKAHLIRTYRPDCTEGVLVLTEGSRLLHACNVLELPWLDNRRQRSCIPEGTYTVSPHLSEKFGDCFKVANVPDRSGILFHVGNSTADTKGCLLPGTYEKRGKILGSRSALSTLQKYAPDGFELIIYSA